MSQNKVNHQLRLALHSELNPQQQLQAAAIYHHQRNWGCIIPVEYHERGKKPLSIEERITLVREDAQRRDQIFPSGQLVLLGKEDNDWKPLGSIHTVVSDNAKVQETFAQKDTWNAFTHYGQLRPESYTATGNRWVCFAIQTNPDLDRNRWNIKPADLILGGVKALAFAEEQDIQTISTQVELSAEVKKSLGQHPSITYINPLTRLSGYGRFQEKFPQVGALDYARNIEQLVLQREEKHNDFDTTLAEVAKHCSLRFHLSRGAKIEQVIADFRVHDWASRGYGASVLYRQ